MTYTDNLLVRQLNHGNRIVFEQLYEEYYPQLVAFAEGYLFDIEESKEIVQKLFVHLWLGRKDLKIDTSLKGYLFSAVRNKCLNHIRNIKIKDRNKLLYIEATLAGARTEENSNSLQHLEKKLREEIQKLPEQIRKIIILKYYKGKKQKEIATVLGVTENTVKTQLSRGKLKLSSALQQS
ncbi:RNA polymerase sigma-70 factor [Fulvivirga ulvae]|uniref:RNA polymerase sigma-70 factor n=1 Tax=Fulvivirga ulvae TaxID=2904245 RepID=UPI001F2A0FA2|nr:RNA polymerase sigma-70 factor [Fulvivirga ulvae]UII31826.1 RNA polymerase sigma-70 factor [Fulvivirga ulvae]